MEKKRATVKVFISSPDDLGEERTLAQGVIKRLAVEYQRHFTLEPVVWEERALTAVHDFQESIPDPSACDVVVVMLWSKLGSVIQASGYGGMTGTEWEFHDAINHAEKTGSPAVLVYRKNAPKAGNLMDPAVVDQAREDRMRLETFFSEQIVQKKRAYRQFDSKDRLAQMLERHLRSELDNYRVAEAEGLWEGSPFPGTGAFGFDQREIFFGRGQARRRLLHQLGQQEQAGVGFVMITGPSGSGKSSLIQAGLLPLLGSYKAIGQVVVCPWVVMRPGGLPEAGAASGAGDKSGDGPSPGPAPGEETGSSSSADSGAGVEAIDPLRALAAALLAPKGMAAAATTDGVTTDWVEQALRSSPSLLHPFISSALGRMAEGGEGRLALVVDPFDELFVPNRFRNETRRAFIKALDGLARSGLVWVIGALRSDAIAGALAIPELAALLEGDGQFAMPRIRDDEFLQMIQEPARVAGLAFAQDASIGLDQRLLEDVSNAPGGLALLAMMLERLYQRRDGKQLSFDAYRELDGVGGVLAERAEQAYRSLPAASIDNEARAFRALVTYDLRADRPLPRVAARERLRRFPSIDQFVQTFVDHRLLVSESRSGTGPVVRFAHRALLAHWQRIGDWARENRRDLASRARLTERTERWDKEGRTVDYLLPEGADFAWAKDLAGRWGQDLEPLELLYVDRSEKHIRAVRGQRLRRWAGASVLVALVVVAAFAMSHATRNFQAGSLEKAEAERRGGNVARTVVLAVESDLLPDGAARVLSRAFSREHLVAMVNQRDEYSAPELAGGSFRATFSADGRSVVTIDATGRAALWRLAGDGLSFDGPIPLHGSDGPGVPLLAAIFYRGNSDGTPVDGRRLALLSEQCLWLVTQDRLDELGPGEPALMDQNDACDAPQRGVIALRLPETGRPLLDARGQPLLVWGPDGHGLVLARERSGRDTGEAGEGGEGGEGAAELMSLLVRESGLAISGQSPLPAGARSLVVSPDGGQIALSTGSGDLCTAAMDGTAFRCDRVIAGGRPANQVAFSPDGNTLAVASADQTVRLYRAGARGSDGAPACIGVLGSKRSGESGGKASWYDPGLALDCSKGIQSAKVHEGAIRAVAFSADGARLASAGDDRQVVVWTLDGDRDGVGVEVLGRHDQSVNAVLFAPAGALNLLLSSSIDHTARLWDIDDVQPPTVFGHDDAVVATGFLASAAEPTAAMRLMTVSAGQTVRLWQVESLHPIAFSLQGHQGHVWHVGFRQPPPGATTAGQSSGRVQLLTTAFDGRARVWDLDLAHERGGETGFRYLQERIRGSRPKALPPLDQPSLGAPVRYADFANRDDSVVTATNDGRITVWSVAQQRARCSIDVGGAAPSAALLPKASFSPDDDSVLIAQTGVGVGLWQIDGCDGRTLRGCDAKRCTRLAVGQDVTAAATAIGDGDAWHLAVGYKDGGVAVFAPGRSTEPVCEGRERHRGLVVDVSFSPDHNTVVSAAADGTAALWDARSCRRIGELGAARGGHEHALYSARFAPSGERIVTAAQDGVARVWARDGTLIHRLVGHQDRIYAARFSPDGRWVLTASRDGAAMLWDTGGQQQELTAILELAGNGSGISSAAFSPDGRMVLTGYWDPGAALWDVLDGTPFEDMHPTMHSYARRFVELNRLQQWRVRSVAAELPWWQELGLSIWNRLE